MKKFGLAVAVLAVAVSVSAAPKPRGHPQAEAEALDLARKAISLRSVIGPGNQTPEVAALYGDALVKGGFDPKNVAVARVDDTAYLIATWPGSDPRLKPMVISGHMDVVEAKPSDWQRDPFTPVVENGYLFGRGASDMKLDGTIAIAALGELRRSGFKPRRTIVIEFSGDEETTMKTSEIIAEKLKDSDIVLNIDGAGGALDEVTGKPTYWTWQGAEKTYADFEMTVTNPGGHSSAPRPVNAIVQMAKALEKIGAYNFQPEMSDLTRASLLAAAPFEAPEIGAALKAFVANPADEAALRTLRTNPSTVGRIATTCVPTMVNGGHGLNALPQKVTANINCRIFPGHKPADIMAELARVAGDPAISFKDVTIGSVPNDASPMRADFVAAATKAIRGIYPAIPIIPTQASGASDCQWFRYHHTPCYGASPTLIKESDEFAHGLNERMPVSNIAPAITYYLSLFADLSK